MPEDLILLVVSHTRRDARASLSTRFLTLLLAAISSAVAPQAQPVGRLLDSSQAPESKAAHAQSSQTPRVTPITGRAVDAQLSARAANPDRTGPCPAQENFTGAITTNGAAEVTYTWVSFDRATWPQVKLHFSGPGTQSVSEHAKIGAAGQTVHGWMQLKVLSPNPLVSPRAQYTMTCPSNHVAGKVVAARLAMSSPTLEINTCPVAANFSGSITTDGAAHVTYTWASSDNRTWPRVNLRFTGADTQPVNEGWVLGKPGQVAQGWMELKILSPNAYATKLNFKFRCSQ
ncbi:MAG TPA: hypothetical protein VN176_04795 [Verrucomicrobiae bacterium]|jgi:hypothetical protein|nr:hypothetical protein [Verrucomicrobiae bacterium]